MKTHWTNRSIEDYLYRIATDFIVQLQDKMESPKITQSELADRLGLSKGRISQVFNNPEKIYLETAVKFSKALNMKVAIVAYEDDDPEGENGPVNSEIFKICWERANKPRDFGAFEEQNETKSVSLIGDTGKYAMGFLAGAANKEGIRTGETEKTSGSSLNNLLASVA